MKYPFIRRFHPEMVEPALWDDRMLFLLLSAGAMGLVSVVLWDTLFPARRDAFVLTPLPVPLPVQMLGRLVGLRRAVRPLRRRAERHPGVHVSRRRVGDFLAMPRAMLGALRHGRGAADAFVFFSVTSLQGIVILGARAARRRPSRVGGAGRRRALPRC